MGMFDSISFNPPDFQMGDDNGGLLKKFLRRKDNDRMRQEDQQRQEQFQAGLLNFRKRQEMDNVSKVMNPQTQQTQAPNVKFAPYNPGLDEFRRDQTQLGRDKLNLAKEKQENQANLANRGMDVKERVAKLKDMPDSERFKLLQEGKIDLAEYNAAKSMERVVKQGEIRSDQITQQGDIRSGQITQQGDIRANEIKQRGDIGSSYITQRADEARKTKAAPSSGSISNSQQKVALQNRAVQMANQNPELAQYLSFNDQGFPVIKPDAPMEAQMEIYKTIYGASATSQVGTQPGSDVNLPAGQPAQPNAQPAPQSTAPSQPNTGMPTNEYGVMQKTGMIQPGNEFQRTSETPLPSAPGNNSFVTMITPDGKGTRIVPKNQVPVALQQGYKPQGGGR